jgi:hypothetical protein
MISIKKNSKIYIACPANYASGGPELLHQLCHTLRSQNFPAFMYYYSSKKITKYIHDSFADYNIEYVTNIVDSPDNILIVPETKTKIVLPYKNLTKIVWWLSVDNYFYSSQTLKGRLKNKFKIFFNLNQLKDPKIYHFFQSFYAKDFLLNNGFLSEKLFYLSDYLNDAFIEQCQSADYSQKKDIILYNPKKGFEVTQKLIEYAPYLHWVAIENMTRAQVINLLQSAKVYIDFGNHPGKDRIPREAAIAGCCVITNTKGSAAFDEDVRIPTEFKIDNDQQIVLIVDKIKDCIDNYATIINLFKPYRDSITQEHSVFLNQTFSILKHEQIK